jgi:hypothetical protein
MKLKTGNSGVEMLIRDVPSISKTRAWWARRWMCFLETFGKTNSRHTNRQPFQLLTLPPTQQQ